MPAPVRRRQKAGATMKAYVRHDNPLTTSTLLKKKGWLDKSAESEQSD